MVRESQVRALRSKGPIVLALALALLAVASIGASAMLLTNTVTLNVQEPITVKPITDNFPARTTASRTYDNVITIDFTKGGFVGGQVANVKVELVITDTRIGDFQSFTVEILDASGNSVATLTKTTPVDSFQVTVPSPLSALSYNVKITFTTGRNAISNFVAKLSAQITYVS
jgi:hypothetical protein